MTMPLPIPTDPPTSETLAAFVHRARAAGHPVLTAAHGRWGDASRYPRGGYATPDADVAPNDLLDTARDVAQSRIAWVHLTLPTATDAVRLAVAVTGSGTPALAAPGTRTARSGWSLLLRRPTRTRSGDPRRVPFAVLVDEMPVSAVTLTEQHAGRTVHVVEIPAAWLNRPLAEVTR
jgi:hypothetical protein